MRFSIVQLDIFRLMYFIFSVQKMNCSVNQLAPEALLRNEYTQGSDVWSVAVVIWEIMTGGKIA